MRTTRTERKIREETSPTARATRRLTRERLRSLVRELVLDGEPVPDWHDHAACAGMGEDLFFPPTEKGPAGVAAVERAKAVCALCPVRTTCLADAMTRESPSARYGVWGGLSAGDRGQVWNPARKRAGFTRPTREDGTHALRHHFASVLLDAGESIKAVSEYLGHWDAGFTLATYTHLMPSSATRTRRAIDGWWSSLGDQNA